MQFRIVLSGYEMNSVLATMEERVSPVALASGAPTSLRVGTTNHGVSLYETFVVDADKHGLTALETIKGIAESGLTHTEFSVQCKNAQAIADTADKANGFVAAEDAKTEALTSLLTPLSPRWMPSSWKGWLCIA
jgi:hypothetical protein